MGSIPTRVDEIFKFTFSFFFGVEAPLISAIQLAKPPEFGGKWGTECLYTKFSLPALLCAGYSVKRIFFII